MKKFDQNETYEWSGSFWFPDQPQNLLSGKLTYAPEKGIKLELVTSALYIRRDKAVKIMHASLFLDGNTKRFSIFDVYLSVRQTSYGDKVGSQLLIGNARYLVADYHAESQKMKSLEVEYDNHFNNIFCRDDSDLLSFMRYDDKPAKIKLGEISLSVKSWGTGIHSSETLDEMIWVYNRDNYKLEELKNAASPIIDKYKYDFHKRIDPYRTVFFKSGVKTFDKYIRLEAMWRSFWELVIDNSIAIKSVWASFPSIDHEKKVYYSAKPVLFSYYRSGRDKTYPLHHLHLPLNIRSFGLDEDLAKIESAFNKWIDINSDSKWDLIRPGIKDIICENGLIYTEEYLSMFAYAETILDILSYKNTHPDQLIKTYAYKGWKPKVRSVISEKLGKNETLGGFLKEIRNTITHPKTAEKKKGIYINVARDQLKIQKLYGHLAGLVLKAILLYLHNFSKEEIDKYAKRAVDIRASYQSIKYK